MKGHLLSDPRSNAGRPGEPSRLFGQVMTPSDLAAVMASRLLDAHVPDGARILDPCVGEGALVKAIARVLGGRRVVQPTIVDVDDAMVRRANVAVAPLFSDQVSSITGDYLLLNTAEQFDLAIANPPYVRQEWIGQKAMYRAAFAASYGLNVPGTSNLYVYFIVKLIMDLKPGGRLVAITYDSWHHTRYGKWLVDFLRQQCSSLEELSVVARPFEGRLIDATIISATKGTPISQTAGFLHDVKRGVLGGLKGMVPIGELFPTSRGLRLKQADFFLTTVEEGARTRATPFVKKIGAISGYGIPQDHPEAALLISHDEKPDRVVMGELKRRIRLAQRFPEDNASILTWYNERPHAWFAHRRPLRYPILLNYYLRHRPRHIHNPSRAFADNFYGVGIANRDQIPLWLAVLNSSVVSAEILSRSRNQGNGLAKVQLYEYRTALIPSLGDGTRAVRTLTQLGQRLIEPRADHAGTLDKIDGELYRLYGFPELAPRRAKETLTQVAASFLRPHE